MNKIETNFLSKIYQQRNTNIKFSDVDEAKSFFLTPQAQEIFEKYCHKQKWKLTDDSMSLHWTICFTPHSDENAVPFATRWRDAKASITDRDEWFVHPNWPIIDHDADHLF